ncbi:MAG: DUF2851 family protein [Cryomorphaceae bacterium]
MNEDFLHYLWKFQQFTDRRIKTHSGEEVDVIQVGEHNVNAGPDFLNARVRIGETKWAGNVEIHINSSDWYAHNHQNDRAYDSVILHVVYANDKSVIAENGEEIPTVELKDLIDYQSFRYYKSWVKKAPFIACEAQVGEVPGIVKSDTIQSAAVERLEHKSQDCLQLLRETKGDVEEAFFRMLCRAMGQKVNALPFEHLAKITPFKIFRKVMTNEQDSEALLLGQGGFLDAGNKDPYVIDLQNRYRFLVKKFGVTPMPVTSWKLLRLRPPNFPVVRIAQLAKLYHKQGAIAQRISEATTLDELERMFSIELNSPFWKTHYNLSTESKATPKRMGKQRFLIVVINAVIPFLFSLASFNKDRVYQLRAISFLEDLPAEANAITRRFRELGFDLKSAFDSQGILGLKKNYCDRLKCLNCKIGIHILRTHAKSS